MPSEVVNFDYLLRGRVINERAAQENEDGGNGLFCVKLHCQLLQRAILYKNEMLTKAPRQCVKGFSTFSCVINVQECVIASSKRK